MRIPSFHTTRLMVFVAIAAVDFAAIREVCDRDDQVGYLLGLGALPMANVLVVGLIIGYWRRRDPSFFMGFELFGGLALATYLVSARVYARESVLRYLSTVQFPIIAYLDKALNLPIEQYSGPYYTVVAIILGLPLLAFALTGGLLARRISRVSAR